MSDTMKCDGCGATGRRGLGRIAPDGWLYLEAIDSDGEAPTIVVPACSVRCAESIWKPGPGRLDLADDVRDGRTSEQRLAAENAELRKALEAIRDAVGEHGNFWKMRQFLDARDIYSGDLSGDAVIEAVCKTALNAK